MRRRVQLLLLASDLSHALGTFSGAVHTDDGERLAFDGLAGWAEDHRARW